MQILWWAADGEWGVATLPDLRHILHEEVPDRVQWRDLAHGAVHHVRAQPVPAKPCLERQTMGTEKLRQHNAVVSCYTPIVESRDDSRLFVCRGRPGRALGPLFHFPAWARETTGAVSFIAALAS